MELDIIDRLSQLEGIEKLPPVDPNLQGKAEQKTPRTNALAIAVIPAMLAGFYKYTRDEEHAAQIIGAAGNIGWPELLFGDDTKRFRRSIAAYAKVPIREVAERMQHTAQNIVLLVNRELSPTDAKAIKNYFTSQRTHILQRLPAAIEAGDIMNDTTLDDRTNKMSGPVSGLMHRIEKTFASTDTAEDKDRSSKF